MRMPKKEKELESKMLKKFSYNLYNVKKAGHSNIYLFHKAAKGEGVLFKNGGLTLKFKDISPTGEQSYDEDIIVFTYVYTKDIFKKMGYKKRVNINQEYDRKASLLFIHKIRNKKMAIKIDMFLDDVFIENMIKNKIKELTKDEFLSFLAVAKNNNIRMPKNARVFELHKDRLYVVA